MTPAVVAYTRVPSTTASGAMPLRSSTVVRPSPSGMMAILPLAGELDDQLE